MLSPDAKRRGLARVLAAALLAPAFAPGPAAGQERWSAELFAGTAWSLPTPLRIRQRGEPELRLRARWSTRPWTGAPYYAYRFGRWSGRDAVEAGLVHHKLYLDDPPPEVQRFEVSHGYNLAAAGRAHRLAGGPTVRFGVGVVVAHPEGRVRGRPVGPVRSLLGGGYHVAGFTSHLSVGHRLPLTGGFFAAPEAMLTASTARVPLRGGSAVVPNVALHALGGLGYER